MPSCSAAAVVVGGCDGGGVATGELGFGVVAGAVGWGVAAGAVTAAGFSDGSGLPSSVVAGLPAVSGASS
ncbi:MAG: hypothetical protein HY941_10195 [Gammaproteobacteria bacterium]|nr:hypothetical protein [Gammaproteobacteria bacterium]